ncbi:hypothetical protein E2C01_050566 [Portunus trituberculatus]|uniref:Uncharacterized protein n=1 Tax=Portunus trituberculatus TaxID=210409 RepID=A0A5B7GCG5_PORTR|nr:hypothetical protein [Portunus trituberculatus]
MVMSERGSAHAGTRRELTTLLGITNMPALEDHQLGETDSLLGSEHNYKFDSSDGSDGYYYKELEDWTHYPGKRISYGTCKQREGITLIWRELSVYVPGKKTCFTRRHNQYQPVKKVLSNVFGAVQPGSLLAMMGAR